jgi:hypothetical protein
MAPHSSTIRLKEEGEDGRMEGSRRRERWKAGGK